MVEFNYDYGARLFQTPLYEKVDLQVAEQTITLPGSLEDAGQMRVELLDEEGQPLLIDRLETHCLKQTAKKPGPWIQHDPGLCYGGGHRWTLPGLAPGLWRIWVWGEGGGITSEEVSVAPREEGLLVLRLPRRPWLAGVTEEIGTHLDGLLAPDPENGFADYMVKGQSPRILGQRALDAYLRHTFTFPPGELSAAHLILDLEAESGYAGNDSIALEYIRTGNSHRWAWSHVIGGLSGTEKPWQNRARGHIELDLARLPLKNGETRSLLESMEDGKLDLMIQDDTFVHSLRLKVVHR